MENGNNNDQSHIEQPNCCARYFIRPFLLFFYYLFCCFCCLKKPKVGRVRTHNGPENDDERVEAREWIIAKLKNTLKSLQSSKDSEILA